MNLAKRIPGRARAILPAAGAGLALAVAASLLGGPPSAPDGVVTVAADDGPFVLYVTGSALLDARQSVTLSSELPSNSAKLVQLVDEGTMVRQGDVVATFDPAPFEQEVAGLERELRDARAALAQAEADLQLQVAVGREGQAGATQAIETTALRLKSLSEADRPLRIAKARNDVAAARATLARAREEHAAQQEMFEAGFGSRAMVDGARATEDEAANSLALAEQALRVLERISLPAEIEQARIELVSKERERRHQEQSNLQALAKQNAALTQLRSAGDDIEARLAAARRQLDQTRVLAPVPGFVVYKKIAVNGETRKAQVGDSVWHRHGFMVIPDMTALVATVNVPEQEIGRVSAGQPVRLRPDAYPDLELSGRVEAVGTLADDGAGASGSLFQVRIAVEGVDQRLRPGMRAQARILTGRHEDVLRVPVEAVFYDAGQPVCFVWSWGEPRRRPVVLGDSDGEYVVVREGLSAGDRLLLAWPVDVAGS